MDPPGSNQANILWLLLCLCSSSLQLCGRRLCHLQLTPTEGEEEEEEVKKRRLQEHQRGRGDQPQQVKPPSPQLEHQHSLTSVFVMF